MRLTLLSLLPLALAAPAIHDVQNNDNIPELTASQWGSIQKSFGDSVRGLSAWSWNKAEEVLEELETFAGEGVRTEGDEEELTIWQRLKADPHSFSKLVKIIEFEGKASKYLDDKDAQITFFAPNNDALTPPKHKHHDDDDDDDDSEDSVLAKLIHNPSLQTLSALLERDPSLTATHHHGDHDGDSDKDKERRKKIFREITGKILQYHGLHKPYTVQELGQNSTLETVLRSDDGTLDGLHRRVRIDKSFVPPSIKLNFYAKIVAADRKTRNGYFHALDHPLIPPGSILQELFLFPDSFSTLTSSVQKIDEAHLLDWKFDREHSKRGHPKFTGTPLATIFAPTNAAFHLLPAELKFYLFSPFGEKALKKILAYHYIPHTLLLSEKVHVAKHNDHHGHKKHSEDLWSAGDDPSFKWDFDIKTALPNATLHLVLEKSKFLPVEGAVKTTIQVNGDYAEVIDIPAWNGASHVIGKVLVPPHHHHDEDGNDISGDDSWENWEEWVPEWAAGE
ncbi:hypothetical protein IAT38_002474 [Cryptococcus sp. DSM 104549]